MDTCICMTESLSCTPETIITNINIVNRLYPNTKTDLKKSSHIYKRITAIYDKINSKFQNRLIGFSM